MAAAAAGPPPADSSSSTSIEPDDWSRSPSPSHSTPRNTSSPSMAPDQTSPRYPDRLIRPLPKRRLRSRLSEEEAKRIEKEFSPNPMGSSPGRVASTTSAASSIFGHVPYVDHGDAPRSIGGRAVSGGARAVSMEELGRGGRFVAPGIREGDDGHRCDCGQDHGVPHDVVYADDDDAAAGTQQQQQQLFGKPGPGSTTSSADGYESFENTNNKKKRKIPSALGGHVSAGSHLSAAAAVGLSKDMGNMSLSAAPGSAGCATDENQAVAGAQGHYGHSSGTGISGAGRGRFGRPKHEARAWMERRPLSNSTNGANAYKGAVPPSGKGKREWGSEDQGIISAAIASAHEQAQSLPPMGDGSENVTSLMQQASKSVSPPGQMSQFTFSMDSESGKALYNTQAVPPPPAGHIQPQAAAQYAQHQQQQTAPPPANAAGQQQQKQPRPLKPLSRLYQLAARKRRLQQEYQNFHHPPTTREDVWICEFCEYEAIFGKEPSALVRQYEEKDRKERKRLAEKRRLLEKAKMKGRKGRKGGKKNKKASSNNNGNNSNNVPANSVDQAEYDRLEREQYDAAMEGELQGEDEFFDEEEDGFVEDEGVVAPPATPTKELQDGGRLGVGAGGAGAAGSGTAGGGSGGGGSTQVKQGQAGRPMGRTRRA